MSTFTYEVGITEFPHPDPDVVHRLREVELSDCPFGCKIYADPKSAMRVLVHSSVYGCRRQTPPRIS